MIRILETIQNSLKNDAEDNWQTYPLQEDIILLICNGGAAPKITLEVNASVVQYFFCLRGSAQIFFAPAQYRLDIQKGESYFFYNPEKVLKPTIQVDEGTKLVSIFCTLDKIHNIFLGKANELNFLSGENAAQKYYKKDTIPPAMEVALHQLMQPGVLGHALNIYRFAKTLEIFSLYFAEEAKENKEYCPYLNDEDSVRKIKQAKEILIQRMGNPPTIHDLAIEVDLNEFRLKEGFKSLYGTTLFNYLLDYKMNEGRNLLDTGNMQVQEVAYDLGYTNPSHFISAFKNKFGVTPKKYLQNR